MSFWHGVVSVTGGTGVLYLDLREQSWLGSAGFNDVLDLFKLGMLFVSNQLQEDGLAGGNDDAGTSEPLCAKKNFC